ncbi:DUF4190 domain-containing protein [Nocardia paucivorans]|uniref:DUF4190 domain-containing protein n=1 Tax=Nocardia paucivorans TaxID=114259 RepID=UPI000593701F|nr:DUF4190 domain-containing protein [Nocardia paucivorans]
MNYPPPQYGHLPYGPPPDHPQATTVLILGVLGMAFCQVVAPFAWVMGKRVLGEIDSSGGTVGGRNLAMVGYVCGIIGSFFLILTVIAMVVWLVFLFPALGSLDSPSADPSW